MPTQERLRSRGHARARRVLADFAAEIRSARCEAGLSQDEVGRRAGVSGDKVWKIEHEQLETLSIVDACLIASVLGLDLTARLYPSGVRVRDASQAARLVKLVSVIGPPLRYRTDVPLPSVGAFRELRAWDVLITGLEERTGVELETRLTDVQATTRRHNQKRADDPIDHFLLVVADTRHNRVVMSEFARLLGDLAQRRTSEVLVELRAGRHPGSGWFFF